MSPITIPVFTHIIAGSIDDGWFNTVRRVMLEGRLYKISSGSFPEEYRKTLSIILEMHKPGTRPLAVYIPEGSQISPPTTEEQIQNYFYSLISSDKSPNEHYTYGEDTGWLTEEVIKYYKKYGFENACCYIGVGRPESFLFYNRDVDYNEDISVIDRVTGKRLMSRHITNKWNQDPNVEVSAQCLRGIDTWIDGGKLHFACYFRSNDLFYGFPQNYGGIQLLKEYMTLELGLEDGPLITMCKDMHIYEHNFDQALMRINKTPQEVGIQGVFDERKREREEREKGC